MLIIACPGLALAGDLLYFTYGFENGNNLTGQHYGQQEYRHNLSGAFDKKMESYRLSSEFSLYYSSLDKAHLKSLRVGFDQIVLGNSIINVYLGDNNVNLPYNAGVNYSRIRGIRAEYRYKGISAGIYGGAPSYLYQESYSLNDKSGFGSYIGIKPLNWLSGKLYIYNEESKRASDTLYRRAVGFGQQFDVTMPWGLNMMLGTAWKRRNEICGGSLSTKTAPFASASITWAQKKYRITGGMDFLGAYFRPLQTKNYYGPRLLVRWQPYEIFGLDGRVSNYNANGDTLYPMITNSWGAGTSMKLPNLPAVKVNYSNTDKKVDWGGPNSRWYVTDDRSVEFSQGINRFEMDLRYQVSDRVEKNLQSMDATRRSWHVKPLYRTQLATFWASGDFDRWDDSRQNNSGYFRKYRAGGNVGLWAGSRAIAELGFNDRGDRHYGRNGSLIANLQLKFNLSKKYLLDLTWWNENNIAQDTGFFYLRDRSKFGLFVTRRMDISGNVVEGLVFLDANKNGTQDAGEYGLPGVILNLSDGRRTITDAKGRYQFNKISSRNPTVKLDISTVSAEYNIIGPGEKQASLGGWRSTLINFSVSALGGIKGRVFVDENDNGKFDGDDYGLSGATLILQPSNSASVSNGGGMFRITNVPTGRQTLSIDPNSIPPDYELKTTESKEINIKQGEISNHLEFLVVKKVRPVKKVVFGGVSTVKIDTAPRAEARPRATGIQKQKERAPKQQDRVIIKAKEPSAKLSSSEIDALYKEGTRLYSSGDYQGALRIWQKILAADPGHSQAKRNLEKTRQKLEALKKAKG
jgi:hypothetical protein